MENTNYLFSLKVEGTEFSVGGDKEFVESYMNKWLVLFKDKIPNDLIGEKQENNNTPQQQSRGKLSIGDFIKMKSPKTPSDLALTLFFYNERYEGMENTGVGLRQIQDIFNKVTNNSQDVSAIAEALLAQGFIQLILGSENNPKYQVTYTGEQVVKQGFSE